MPGCRRNEAGREKSDGDWREPPGWLGDIVRRVKRLSQAGAQTGAPEWRADSSGDLR